MTPGELEAWWRSQETFDSNPDGIWDPLFLAFGETPPPHRYRMDLPGQYLAAESDEEVDLWMSMVCDGLHYLCGICCDTDSYLKRPDGGMLLPIPCGFRVWPVLHVPCSLRNQHAKVVDRLVARQQESDRISSLYWIKTCEIRPFSIAHIGSRGGN